MKGREWEREHGPQISFTGELRPGTKTESGVEFNRPDSKTKQNKTLPQFSWEMMDKNKKKSVSVTAKPKAGRSTNDIYLSSLKWQTLGNGVQSTQVTRVGLKHLSRTAPLQFPSTHIPLNYGLNYTHQKPLKTLSYLQRNSLWGLLPQTLSPQAPGPPRKRKKNSTLYFNNDSVGLK